MHGEQDVVHAKRTGCYTTIAFFFGLVLLSASIVRSTKTDNSSGDAASSSTTAEPSLCRVLSTNYTTSYSAPSWIMCNLTAPTFYEISVFVTAPWNDQINVMCFPTEHDQCDQINVTSEPACHGFMDINLNFLDTAQEDAQIGCKRQGSNVLYDSTQTLDSASSLTRGGWIFLAIVGAVMMLIAGCLLTCLICAHRGPAFLKRGSVQFLRSANLLPRTHHKLDQVEKEDLIPEQVPEKAEDRKEEVKFGVGDDADEAATDEEKQQSELLTLNLKVELDPPADAEKVSSPEVAVAPLPVIISPPSPPLSAASSSSSSSVPSPSVVKVHL